MEAPDSQSKPASMNLVEIRPFLNNNLNGEEKSKITFSKNLKAYFSQYCDATSIHGIQYLGQPGRYIIEKIVWIAVILTVACLCLVLIHKTYDKWQTSPVIVTFSTTETSISEIPFPAVTICPQAKFNPEVFNYTKIALKRFLGEDLDEIEEELFSTLSLSCSSVRDLAELFRFKNSNKTIEEAALLYFFLATSPINPTEATTVEWLGQELDIEDALTPTFTSEGVCYTFNMLQYEDILNDAEDNVVSQKRHEKNPVKMWSLQNGYPPGDSIDTYPRRTFLPGITGGLLIDALFTNHTYLDYLCDESLQGYKVVLHHPSELPDMDKHFRLPLDYAVYVGIKPTMITVSEALLDYRPEDRKCYFAEEKPLRMYKLYTQQNCLSECLANYTFSQCGCVAFYMPTIQNTPICGLGSYLCVLQSKVKYLEINNSIETGGQRCGCLPSCTSLSYEVETSQTEWNWRKMFQVFHAVGLSSLLPDEKESHFSRLVVYYKDLQFLTSERNELYGYVDFFSNVGGLLGLFIGFSVTSAVEILYFLTLRLVCNIQKYGRQVWSGDLDLINN